MRVKLRHAPPHPRGLEAARAYGARTLRFSTLLAVSRPWQIVTDHVARAEVPLR
jgi:hypothetical protein